MANYRKITRSNFQPTQTSRGKFPVYHDLHNEMLGDNDNELLADTITEKTANNGVVIEGVTLKDGGMTQTGTSIANGTTTSSGAGAVGITGTIHEITTTRLGDALTLADGTEGQILRIVYVAESSEEDSAVLTPTNLGGADTIITFNNLGDAVTLLFTSGAWYGVGVKGAVFS